MTLTLFLNMPESELSRFDNIGKCVMFDDFTQPLDSSAR